MLAWLSARAAGGAVLLRIEDIDSPRVKPWASQQALDDLRWLQLDWDAGPDIGGPSAPYVQTARQPLYDSALQQLRSSGLCYPCVCSRKDIQLASAAPNEGDEGPIYPGTCRTQADDAMLPAEPFCWRLRATNEALQFDDVLLGSLQLNPAQRLGDFPITRKEGGAAYHLAVVVDDEAMGVTEVVRGNDLVPSTFRHIQLQKTLHYQQPRYAHVGLVRGADGRRLAKRHGDTRLSTYRAAGVRPQRIVGLLAWTAGLTNRREEVAPSELVPDFSWNDRCASDYTLTAEAERWLHAG